MSQQEIDEVIQRRVTFRQLYPEFSKEEVEQKIPLPGSPAGTKAAPPKPNKKDATEPKDDAKTATNSNQQNGATGSSNGTAKAGSNSVKNATAASTQGTADTKPFSCLALTMAERSRQEAIREMMAKYLSLYPGVDNSYAEKLYKNDGKWCIYSVVVKMMKSSGYTVSHFQEAFDFYTWLPNHEPSPAEDPTKKTLLHYACLFSRPDLLTVLLCDYGARSDAKDEKGYIPFFEAAKSGNLACLEILYSKGFAYFDRRDVENRTSLMIAAFFNQKEAVKKLLEWGANADSKDSHKATVQDIARTLGHNEVAEVIRLFRREQSERNARATALKRWTSADPLNRRLYEAWQHSPNPHPTPVNNVQFNLAPAHNIEADNIELVRMNRYDVSSQRNYFGNQQGHSDLFLCLAYLGSPLICSRSDCLKALKRYEGTLRAAGLIEVHPLYFLAIIRLTKDDAPLRRTLLYDFVQQYPATLGRTVEKGGWLTVEEEKESLEEIESTKEEEAEPVPETLRDKWNAFATAVKLTTPQREAMDELMNLTGLATVKELAMDLYIEAQENGFKPPTGTDGAPREYNFAFLGNPGTGKTTVARLLSKILEATGLRAGHKVIEMTASDALRKGVQKFSDELAALTGGDNSIGPPANSKLLRKGLNVEVLHGTKWFPGKIARVVKTQKPRPTPPAKPNEPPPTIQYDEVITYDVIYPDGTEDTGMSQFDDKKKPVLRHVDKSTAAGGVLFLDEAYDLDPAGNTNGRHIMADIMKVAEDCRDRVSIILAGYKDDIENKLYAYNSGMRDRFRAILFEDFDENELLEVWEGLSKAAGWKEADTPGQMSVSRVAARRLAQRASIKGFANARSVRVMFNQSVAVAKRRPNHNKLLIVEDVIGVPPVPERIPALAAALKELHEHIGIPQVKEAVRSLCDVARKNYDKELNGMKTDMIPLNRLFLGNPGTGKSTIASIYGRILKNLLLLSKGEVIERKASDFIGDVIGASETRTRGILSLAKGCVLIIDEAYNLNDGHFGKAALNTIVENVSNAPGSDIAVIMIGYEKNMLAMLNEQNPGLCSRFDPTNAFRFEDFTDLELLQIFSSAAARDQVDVPIDIKCAAVRHLAKQRNMKNFGNARAVITLLGAAKSRMNSRMQKNPAGDQAMTLDDLLGEDANLKANPLQCIDELQGGDDEYGFRTVLRQLGNSINVCSLENRPYDPVGNFIFTGAPGTGKTTVASKMAKMLNAFGVLASNHVVVTTALDLTGQYVGQSKKVIEGKMEEARGGVLFIDEAYKLGEGSFGEEVLVKLLGMLTEPEYNNGKTIVILAGYEADMNAMLSRNAGMASRFNERIHFSDWTKEQCVDLVENMARNEKPLPFVSNDAVRSILLAGFQELLKRPNWANARDSESMYKYLKKSRDRRRSNEVNTTTLLAHKNTENCLHFTEEDARMAVDIFLRNRSPAPAPNPSPFRRNGFANMPPPPEAFANFTPPSFAPPAFKTATTSAKTDTSKDANSEGEIEDDLCQECTEEKSDRVEELDDEEYNNPDPNADQFSAARRAQLEQSRREHEARMAAEAQAYAELLALEAANAAEMERMRAEQAESDKRHAELVAAEKKRVEEELAELARIEAERKAAHEAEMERVRLEHEEALRKAEAERQEALRKEQEAEQKRLREEAEARKKAHEAEVERRRLVAEQQERERAAAEAARKVREAEEKKRLEAEQARTALLLAEQQRKIVEARKQEVVRTMGLCSAGFIWQKVSGGYRCAGGSHYVTESDVDRLYNQTYR